MDSLPVPVDRPGQLSRLDQFAAIPHEPPLSREERLRRVVLLCSGFTRNFAYYRAAMERMTAWRSSDFWCTTCSNFLDQAVLEWCKLFVDKKWDRKAKANVFGVHHWKTIAHDPVAFERDMLSQMKTNAQGFAALVSAIKTYRDTFLAHLDSARVMNIPNLEPAFVAVTFYHKCVVDEVGGRFVNLPADQLRYSDFCTTEARRVYGAMS
jgi:hypothetical protein